MLDIRRTVVPVFAVLIALSVGIVLGSGPLDEPIQNTAQVRTAKLRHQQQALRSQLSALQARAGTDEAFVEQVAGPLTASQLASRTVAVFALPGADPMLVSDTVGALEQAGATVTNTVTLKDVYVDPAKASSPLEDLVLRLVPPGVSFATDSTPIERVGTVLARATVTSDPEATKTVDQPAAEVIAGLTELDAIEVDGEPGRLAELAAVVAAPADARAPRRSEAQRGADEALLGLAAALDQGSRGAVVTGPTDSAERGGFVALVRRVDSDLDGVSTVDVADLPVGPIALVLAMVEQADGAAGDYGAGQGADAVVPNIVGG